jgi:hypothetical protein
MEIGQESFQLYTDGLMIYLSRVQLRISFRKLFLLQKEKKSIKKISIGKALCDTGGFCIFGR